MALTHALVKACDCDKGISRTKCVGLEPAGLEKLPLQTVAAVGGRGQPGDRAMAPP